MISIPFPSRRVASRVSLLSSVVIAGISFFSALASASASTLVESFDQPSDLNADWLVKTRGVVDPSVVTVAPYAGSNWLKLDRPATLPPGGGASSNYQAVVYYTGNSVPAANLADFSGAITVNLSSVTTGASDTQGVVVRAQASSSSALSYTSDGYYIAFRAASGTDPGGIGIWKDPVSHTDNGEQLAFETLTGALSAGTDYRLIFSAVGALLQAELTTIDGQTSLASISVNLEPGFYEDGFFGIRASHSSPKATYFRDLTLTTIPEGKTAMFGVLGGAILLAKLARGRMAAQQ